MLSLLVNLDSLGFRLAYSDRDDLAGIHVTRADAKFAVCILKYRILDVVFIQLCHLVYPLFMPGLLRAG